MKRVSVVMVRAFTFAKQKEEGGNDVACFCVVNPNKKCEDLAIVEGGWSRKFMASTLQASSLVISAEHITGIGGTKMSRTLPTRRSLQALALILATAYATILLYQAIVPRQVIKG